MAIEIVGSAGMGLVWGWLLGYLDRGAARPLPSRAIAAAASAGPVIMVWLMAGAHALPVLTAAIILALTAHLSWRRQLLRRFASSPDWRSPRNARS